MRAFFVLSAFLFLLAGRFDLSPGEWSGDVHGDHRLTVEVGSAETKIITLRWHRKGKIRNEISVLGSYQVTATKGEPHVTMHVDVINAEGDALLNDRGGVDIGKWHILPDHDQRLILGYDGKTMSVEVFDPVTLEHLEHFALSEE